jgi:hypothetical protein
MPRGNGQKRGANPYIGGQHSGIGGIFSGGNDRNNPYKGTKVNQNFGAAIDPENPDNSSLSDEDLGRYVDGQQIDTTTPVLDTRSHILGLSFLPLSGPNNAEMLNNQVALGRIQGQIASNIQTEGAKQILANTLAQKLQARPAEDALDITKARHMKYANDGLDEVASPQLIPSYTQRALAGNQAFTDQNLNASIQAQAQRPYLSATTGNEAEAQNDLSAQHLFNVQTPEYRQLNQASELARLKMPLQQLQNAGDAEAGMGQVKFRPPLSIGSYYNPGFSLEGPEQVHTTTGGYIDPKTGVAIPGTEKPITTTLPPRYSVIGGEYGPPSGGSSGGDTINGERVQITKKAPGAGSALPKQQPTRASTIGRILENPDGRGVLPSANDAILNYLDNVQNSDALDAEARAQEPTIADRLMKYLMGGQSQPDSIKHKAAPYTPKKKGAK